MDNKRVIVIVLTMLRQLYETGFARLFLIK